VAASPEEKEVLKRLSPDQVPSSELAGEPITNVLTTAPGNGAPIDGLNLVAEHGWFAARPSGTEGVYKVYAESLRGEDHLERILEEAGPSAPSAWPPSPAGSRYPRLRAGRRREWRPPPGRRRVGPTATQEAPRWLRNC
jgi:hypothetical protein